MAVLIEAESENKKLVSQKFVWDQLAVRIPGDNKKLLRLCSCHCSAPVAAF